MCEALSWKDDNGTLLYLTDKDCRKILAENPNLKWQDLLGHGYIPGGGEHKQCPIDANTETIPLEIHNLLKTGAFDELLKQNNQSLAVLGRHSYHYRSWYDNGQPSKDCTYKNGKLHGRYCSWYENGQPWINCVYKNDKFYGRRRKWYENSQLYLDCTYENGELHGRYRGWYENSQLYTDCTYKNGELHGYRRWWDENGQPIGNCIYENGKFIKDNLHV